MVNPGVFQGLQKEFLLGEKSSYSTTVARGYAADALALIQHQYFKWYPVDLPHNLELSPEFLAAMDDDAPNDKIAVPDQDKMSKEDYQAAVDRLAEHQKLVSCRQAVSMLCLHLRPPYSATNISKSNGGWRINT